LYIHDALLYLVLIIDIENKVHERFIENIVLPMYFPQLFIGSRKPSSWFLLYGPRSWGKHTFVKALASNIGMLEKRKPVMDELNISSNSNDIERTKY